MVKMVNFTLCVCYQIFLKTASKIHRIEEDQETPGGVLLTPRGKGLLPLFLQSGVHCQTLTPTKAFLPLISEWSEPPTVHAHPGTWPGHQTAQAEVWATGVRRRPGWAETTRGQFPVSPWIYSEWGSLLRQVRCVDRPLGGLCAATVFISCCCYKQWPGGFKEHTFILSNLQVSSLTWVPLGWNQGVCRATFLPGGSRGGSASSLFPAFRGSPHSIFRARSPAPL